MKSVPIFGHTDSPWSASNRDDKSATYQIFLPLGKKESSAAEGCTRFLAGLKGRPCICAALRSHMFN